MTKQEQAKIILNAVDVEYSIPSYMEDYVIRGIMAGLKKIEAAGREEEERYASECQ